MMQEIERLAQAGFALHWLHPRSKRPIGNDWADRPVASWTKLKSSYRDGNNVGVRLGKWSVVEGRYLHVFDMDVRDPDLADEAFEALCGMFPTVNFKQVPTVISGSGGASRHFHVLSDEAFPSKKLAHSEGFSLVWDEDRQRDVKKWDWELELFGTGKQVALPPSIHPDTGKPYRWLRRFNFDDLEMGVGPFVKASAIDAIVNANRREFDGEDRSQPLGLSTEEIQGILDDLPLDNYCDDRDGWLQVGMALHHETQGSKEGLKLWNDFSRQSDKFDPDDQRRVWRSFSDRENPVRMASLLVVAREVRLEREFENLGETEDAGSLDPDDDQIEFEDLDEQIDQADEVPERERKLRKDKVEHDLGKKVPPRVAALNVKHAVARVSSKTVIMDFHGDGAVTYGNVDNLHAFYENDRVSNDKATEPVTKAWMRHRMRRSYPNGIVFAPGRETPGAYNHWQGFSVVPDPEGSCSLFLRHIRKHLCNGDKELSDYLIGWMAHMIQRPQEKPGVAVVMRGKKGVGKDTFGDYLGRLMRHHHVKVQNQEQMLGKFNAHQEKVLLLHVEEGYWAGNRGADGALKFLITSDRVMIEPKGMNAFPVDSFLRLFMSSNEDWVVPASADERRYFVLDVDSSLKDNHRYFEALRKEMNGAGPAALLHYLQNYDLTDFNVREVPTTTALADQKAHGLRNFPLWWFQMLQEGRVDLGMQDETGDVWLTRKIRIDRDELREAYTRWHRARRFDGPEMNATQIGRIWREMTPSLEQIHLRSDSGRRRAYVVPPLNVARREFERFIGSQMVWDEDEEVLEEEVDD